MSLPTGAQERKALPIFTGVVMYFPDAIAEVARVSKVGNDQHNPGEPLHWARGKSQDHLDCMIRHAMEHGTIDTDKVRHMAKAVWRGLAELQTEIEAARAGVSVAEWNRRLREGEVTLATSVLVEKIAPFRATVESTPEAGRVPPTHREVVAELEPLVRWDRPEPDDNKGNVLDAGNALRGRGGV